jgi:tripartite-type tricarboxylate transporter receptor subunit TctC
MIRLAVAFLLSLVVNAQAQTFPAKPLRLIVPYTPGGLMDLVGRQLGQNLPENLGQPVVVENRPGAASAVGIDYVKQSPADGYTMVLVEPGAVVTPILQPKTSFNLGRDLQVVSMIAETPILMAVGASVPARDLKELIALARARPGAFNYSSAGMGTTPHMAGELLKAQAKLDIVHVPYKGGSAAIADVLSGQIQMIFLAPTILAPYIKDGRMRALALAAPKRARAYPDVPTFAELGFPEFEVAVWVGLFVVKGTPPEIVARLNQAVQAALARPEFQAGLAKAGLEPIGLAGDAAQRALEREERKWADVVRVNNVKPE